MKAVELVARERQRQIIEEGHTPEKDKLIQDDRLYKMALFYLLDEEPEGFDKELIEKKKKKCRARQLEIAAALICAEIDRLRATTCFKCDYVE